MDDARNTTGMSWINLITALWIISAPLVFHYAGTISQVNDMWVGTIIGFASLIRIMFPFASRFLNWGHLIGGIWLISAPFVLGYTNIAGRWNDVLVGLVVLAVSLMNFGRAKESGFQYKYRHFTRPTYH